LAARGFVEVLSYPFAPNGTVQIANPLAGDRPFLRQTLLETTLEVASLNVRRSNQNVKVFEVGKVFRKKPVDGVIPTLLGGSLPNAKELGTIAKLLPNQPLMFAGIIADAEREDNWSLALQEARNVLLLAGVDVTAKITFTPLAENDLLFKLFHPTRSANVLINGEIVGVAGELSGAVSKDNQLTKRASAFEVDFDKLAKFRPSTPFKAQQIKVFPPSAEDYAFVLDADVPAYEILTTIEEAVNGVEKGLLDSVTLFDEFHSDKLGEGKKSLSFSVVLRADRTLKNEEIQQVRSAILAKVEAKGGVLR
jgi:phenylalanyl-tRNA synthetase beta chain